MTTTQHHTAVPAYVLADGAGIADVWWPFSAGVARYTQKLTGEQTEGRLFQMVVTEPRGAAPPVHVHRNADESFYVLEGDVTFYVDGGEIVASSSDFVFVARGCPHTFLVRSDHARMFVTFGPAGMEGFFTELGTDARRADEPPAPESPDPDLFAAVADRYAMDIVGPPPAP
jgi:quercetin dioxygenase-like cupin family protein